LPAPIALIGLARLPWSEEFRAYTTYHLTVVLLSAVVIAGACVAGRRLLRRGPRYERTFRLSWAWFTLAFQVFTLGWFLLPSHYDHDRSIPLQFCRLAALIAPIALMTTHPLPRALLYFWGLGLSSQALLTPVYREGFAYFAFWAFWLGHLQIVGSAVYDLSVRGYRPTFRDFMAASLLGLAYVALVVPINATWDFNFGYLGRAERGTKTFASYVPPWPWRPFFVWGASQVVVTIFYFAGRRRGDRPIIASEVPLPATPRPSTAPLP
jgi:hypothetical integral membrane protein (TIGR02206 family)